MSSPGLSIYKTSYALKIFTLTMKIAYSDDFYRDFLHPSTLHCHNEHQGSYWYTVFQPYDKTSAVKWQQHCTRLISLWWLKCCWRMENTVVFNWQNVSTFNQQHRLCNSLGNHLLTFRPCTFRFYAQMLDFLTFNDDPSPLQVLCFRIWFLLPNHCIMLICIMIPLNNSSHTTEVLFIPGFVN